ncbi:MAG: DNA polymerase III subunit gamma/tau [Verrucomicrobiota bacterium]|jgi:DNA polymerase-3 subunit gamma/tau|nr:DNA polymerase III subunit gamma/tau [Verrucomicrobiota bacterium]
MSYQVIARRYRPQRFSEVVGQEHVTQTLSNAIASGRVAHAYLLSGPRGTGKTTIARIFAKCLNATDGPTVSFKDDDERCIEIAEGRSLDVLEIDGASNNGVEQVRELRDTAPYAPASCRFKLYIIDEVHMLTTAAFNALLKTLEEPPAHVKFVFATTEPEKVLPTILSRCQRFDLRRISEAKIVEHLGHIAKKEKWKIEDAALQAIARGADGGMRDAESTLDQLISFCGDKVTESDVLSMFGLSSQAQVHSLANAVLEGETETALRELHELTSGGKELGRLVADLLNHFRNLLVYQVSKGDISLLEISEAEKTTLADQANHTDSHAVTRILEVLTDCEMQLRNATSKKILMEVSLVKAIQTGSAMSLNDVLDKLNKLRVEGGCEPTSPDVKSKSAVPVNNSTAVSKEKDKSTTKVVASTVSVDMPKLWMTMMAGLGAFTKSYFAEAYPLSLENGMMTIGFPEKYSSQMELADNRETNKVLIQSLEKQGQKVREIRFAIADCPTDWASASPEKSVADDLSSELAPPKPSEGPVDMEEFRDDPLIQKALEVFKGQIVDVRT